MITIQLDKNYYSKCDEILDWCRANISKNGGWRVPDRERWGDDWGIVISFGVQTYYFIDEEDAILFSLRWS